MSTTGEPSPDFLAFAAQLDAVVKRRPRGFQVVSVITCEGRPGTFILSSVHPVTAAAVLAQATDKAVDALGGEGGGG